MRKLLAILLTMALCLGCTSALAAGKLDVVQENTHFITKYGNYYYAFAKVENTGDKAIKVNAGVLEVYDAEGDAITSTDWVDAHASYLQPGEYTYVSAYLYDGFEDGVVPDDYALTLTGKADKSSTDVRFPVETELQLGVEDEWWSYDYMYATVTNDTQDVVYDLAVVLALLDAEGNILYVESSGMYGVGLTPGSSAVVRISISSDFMEYYEQNGLTPTSVDAIAYVTVDAE